MMSDPLRRVTAFVTHTEVAWLLLMAPALLFPSAARSAFLLGLPALWLCAWHAQGRPVVRTPLDVSVAVLLLMVLVSLYATFDLGFSLPKIAGVLLGVATYYALVRWIDSPLRLSLALAGFVAAGAGFALLALLGTGWGPKFGPLAALAERLPQALVLPGAEEGFQPNVVGATLLLFIPLQLALLHAARQRQAWPWPARLAAPRGVSLAAQAGALGLTAGTLLLTQSRGAWLGLALGLGLWLAWRQPRARPWLLAGTLALGALAAAVGPARLLAAGQAWLGTGLAESVVGRPEVWSRAIAAIRDFPLTGLGLNAFRAVLPSLYPSFALPPDLDIAHAHNYWLQAALDLGLPGLVGVLAVWLGAAGMLAAARRRAGPGRPAQQVVAEGLAAGLGAYGVFGLADAIPLGAKIGWVFWVVLGLAASLHRLSGPLAAPDSTP